MSVSYQSRTLGSSVKLIYSYYASGSIDKGMCLCFDESKVGEQKCEWVKPSPAGAKDYMGIALTNASAGEILQVQHSGYCDYVLVDGNVECGSGLVPSNDDAGVLVEVSSNHGRDHGRHAVAMTTGTGVIRAIDAFIFPTAI